MTRPSRNRRTAAGFAADARRVALAREQGATHSAVSELATNCGARGDLPLSFPSPADKERYPHMTYLPSIGPALAPYDIMRFVLTNVVKSLWQVFSRTWTVLGDPPEDYYLKAADLEAIGCEIRGARDTVPASQARSLRDVRIQWKSY